MAKHRRVGGIFRGLSILAIIAGLGIAFRLPGHWVKTIGRDLAQMYPAIEVLNVNITEGVWYRPERAEARCYDPELRVISIENLTRSGNVWTPDADAPLSHEAVMARKAAVDAVIESLPTEYAENGFFMSYPDYGGFGYFTLETDRETLSAYYNELCEYMPNKDVWFTLISAPEKIYNGIKNADLTAYMRERGRAEKSKYPAGYADFSLCTPWLCDSLTIEYAPTPEECWQELDHALQTGNVSARTDVAYEADCFVTTLMPAANSDECELAYYRSQ